MLQKGYLSVNYSENYFHLSQRHPEVPRFTPAHHEAMELFTSLASSSALRLDGVLEPGDIQLLSNHVSFLIQLLLSVSTGLIENVGDFSAFEY